jgi:hypothetical protein
LFLISPPKKYIKLCKYNITRAVEVQPSIL